MRRDFEPDEKEFVSDIGTSLKNVRAVAGPCPHPDLVMAAASDVRMGSSEVILKHINSCPLCQQLICDLSEYEHPAVTEEEDRRIRARWERPNRQRMRMFYAIGAIAALVLLTTGLFVVLRQGGTPQNLPGSTAGNKESQTPPSVQPARV